MDFHLISWLVCKSTLPSSAYDVPRNWGLTVAMRLRFVSDSFFVTGSGTGSRGTPIELLLELTARNGGEVLVQQ